MPLLEIAIEPTTLGILLFVAFLAGFIDAIAGGGEARTQREQTMHFEGS